MVPVEENFPHEIRKTRSAKARYLPFDTFQIPTPKTSSVKDQAAEGRQAAEAALVQSGEGIYQWRTFFSGLL